MCVVVRGGNPFYESPYFALPVLAPGSCESSEIISIYVTPRTLRSVWSVASKVRKSTHILQADLQISLNAKAELIEG